MQEIKETNYQREESLNAPTIRIGFIGAGQMATNISSGMVNRHVLATNSSIIISDPYTQNLQKLYKTLNGLLVLNSKDISIETTTNNIECIKDCDIVFVAVRPEHLSPIMTQLYSCWTGTEIIVVIPQIEFKILQEKLTDKSSQPILRMLPAPETDVASIMIAKGKNATENDAKLIAKLLRPMGVIKITDENFKSIENDTNSNGFIAKNKGERLDAIARIILMAVYDDDNIWSCLRGMRFIVRDIWELTMDFNKHYWTKFIQSDPFIQSKVFVRKKKYFKHFPKPTNININMMPFIMTSQFNGSYLPQYLKPYWPLIAYCINNDGTQLNKIGYLTVHESFVDKGRSQRRPGLHIETPGIIYINDEQNANICYMKGGGDTEKTVNMAAYWAISWGGGSYSGDMYNYHEKDGIYMACSVDNTCCIWNCKIVQYGNREVIGHLGDIEHLRSVLSENKTMNMESNVMYWLTDRTPHEALPVDTTTYRQFFRLVTKNVNVWYKLHSTPNPNGIVPNSNVTRIIKGSKFMSAQISEEQDNDKQ